MLHIIDQFPLDSSAFANTESGDIVLLTENAVLAVKRTQESATFFKKVLAHINLCVLRTDMQVRGLTISDLLCGVSILDEWDMREFPCNDFAVRSWN